MQIKIDRPYLWLPVTKNNPEVRLNIYLESDKVQEMDIHLGETSCDFYTAWDASAYMGKSLEVCTNGNESQLQYIFCYDEAPQNIYPFRPKLHFSPEIGWHNDPNGLVFADGWYHLYYQWNPYGVVWGNMHWGHAKSRDMIHWEHCPMAMQPNEYGTMYSGCGYLDAENLTGIGENALLFYYTAAGGRNEWSKEAGNKFTQRLAYSLDGGDTLEQSDKFFIDYIINENRDPKIFYHKASGAYIMVLYLDGYEFAVYRSADLLKWEETQRLQVKGMWECPDLLELAVEGTDEKKWIFWSADGYYQVGEFDGFHFTADCDSIQQAYSTRLPYAAQTFANTGDRVISMAWLRMENDKGNYRGLMSLPMQLSLVKKDKGYGVKFTAPIELERMCRQYTVKNRCTSELIPLQGHPLNLELTWDAKAAGQSKLVIGNLVVVADFAREIITFGELESHFDTINISFARREGLALRLIIDQEVVEFLGNDGTIYGAVEVEENILNKWIMVGSQVEIKEMRWCELIS